VTGSCKGPIEVVVLKAETINYNDPMEFGEMEKFNDIFRYHAI